MKAAIAQLEISLENLETNIPIRRAEGDVEQADAWAVNADEIRQALTLLKSADTMPPNYVTELTDPLVQEEVQKANHYWRNEYKSLAEKITEKNEQPNRFAMNGWSLGKPTIDGTYLRAFDESDEDSDGEVYQLIGGSWYKDGEARVCYGGVWKRVGDMQINRELMNRKETKHE